MRVAILIRKWSVRGGNERQAVELARQLRKHGHAVSVYCQKRDDTADGVLPSADVHRLEGVSFDPSAAQLTYAWRSRRLSRTLDVDVTIGFGPSTHQDIYRLGGGVHAAYLRAVDERKPVLDRVALRLERLRVRHTPRFIAPSARVRDELASHYGVDGRRVRVVRNGIDLSRFSPSGPAEDFGANGPVALFVGNEAQRKGLDLAIEVTRRAGIRLVCLGRAHQPSSCPDHVEWIGERRDVGPYYRGADLLLAPSRYEPFGLVVLEALACGLPVVTTTASGASERMLGTPLECLVAPHPEDLAGLSDRVQLALDRAELREAGLSVAASASVETWGHEMIAALGSS